MTETIGAMSPATCHGHEHIAAFAGPLAALEKKP